MRKPFLIPLLLIIACAIAGIYGVLHNQISYTVSPDYFHQFKFIQLNLAPALQGRLGASLVGLISSWWMGIFISPFLLPIGFKRLSKQRYFISMLQAFAIAALTSLVASAIALLLAFIFVTPDNVGEITIGDRQINNPAAFVRAGVMHNFGYLGGFLGVVMGREFLEKQLRQD
ncbi:MAG: hypothetical protein AAGA60_25610 [Cyanobacteria bacterium P01_E01_bin.42]